MPKTIALTGPAAAALWGLDGFRDHDWPQLWCTPRNRNPTSGVKRISQWDEPTEINGITVASVRTVLRHLGSAGPLITPAGLSDVDLAELAVEHALRLSQVTVDGLVLGGGTDPGHQLLREVLARRPKGEPPTESFAETRTVQKLRSVGIEPWRQVPVIGRRTRLRADFMVPYRLKRRPRVIRAWMGLLLELDSREFHEHRFEKDHARETSYDDLGYRWLSFTPNQIENDWPRVARTILRVRDEGPRRGQAGAA
jgi:very-short-patch-repair endonuclease